MSNKLNVLNCDSACTTCIKSYSKKHDLKSGDSFKVSCNGIPKEYIDPSLKENLSEEDAHSMLSMLDPVTWAAEILDWHCEDPDGSIWKRKTLDNSIGEVTPYIEEKYGELVKQGKSAYNRPYQKTLLRCTAKRKVLRLGRQLGKSETMCVSILHALFTHKDFRILIITPYQAQIELLFARLNHLINSKDITKNAVKRYVKSPNHTLELHNGSRVTGFTSGAKSGGNADSVRGQKANMLVFDEADYLNSADMASALSVITNYPDATVWMSSTPTGKRERFYDNCHSPLWKEYHFSAKMNPLWNDDLEAFYRGEFTDIQYDHEVCLAKDTNILTSNGPKNVKDVIIGDLLYDQDLNTINVVTSAGITGIKEVVRHVTTAGNIDCTFDHNFPNYDFVKTSINKLTQLPVYNINKYTKNDREAAYARLVGYNLGDGSSCSTRYQSSFYSDTEADMKHVREDIKFLYPEYEAKVVHDIVRGGPNKLVKVDGPRYTVNVSKKITHDLLNHGVVRGKKTYQEFDVPSFVLQGSLTIKANFLAALFGAEGSTPRMHSKKHNNYTPATISLSMNKQKNVDGGQFFQSLKEILSEFGIESTWVFKVNNVGYRTYSLYVYNDVENILLFFQKVGFLYAKQKEDLTLYWIHYLLFFKYKILEKQKIFDQARLMRSEGYEIKKIKEILSISNSQVQKAIYNFRKPKRLYPIDNFPKFDKWIDEHLKNEVLFVDILKRETLDLQEVYNLTVDSSDHSYLLANGIRTFNCANFGEQEQGVFQTAYVDDAMIDYRYSDNRPDHSNWIYTIGVDWNDFRIGTTIAVMGFNPTSKLFKLMDRFVYQREGWTQMGAIEKIIEWNQRWVPKWIYVDYGFGSTQHEIIKKFGYDSLADRNKGRGHPDSNLAKIVKQYDFGSKIVTKDLFTKQDIDKPAKPFLVENAMRRFEQRSIHFSKYDAQLEAELRGYIIDHVTSTGQPVYKPGEEKVGDHNLDAVMLSLIAITLEETAFGKIYHDTSVNLLPVNFGDSIKSALPGVPIDISNVNGSKQTQNKPNMERADFSKSGIARTQVSGANLNKQSGASQDNRKLWDWPGFMSDKPKPNGFSGSARRLPPVRKKF